MYYFKYESSNSEFLKKNLLYGNFRNTPKTEEDWINLLQQQESLHNVEIKKWQRVLHTAAQLLRQVTDSCENLIKSY